MTEGLELADAIEKLIRSCTTTPFESADIYNRRIREAKEQLGEMLQRALVNKGER